MHAAIQLVVLWVLAFVTLSVSLVLLSIYYGRGDQQLAPRIRSTTPVVSRGTFVLR